MKQIYPDIEWYTSISRGKSSLPRCPYTNVYRCPGYYQSILMFENAGIATQVDHAVGDNILDYWENNELWPIVKEEVVEISGLYDEIRHYANLCPEVAYLIFGLFASHLSKYENEIDEDNALTLFVNFGRAFEKDWRCNWAYVKEMHYLECHLYSRLESFL